MQLESFAEGKWHTATNNLRALHHAVTGELVAETGSDGLDFAAMRRYAITTGGPALRKMTFHERARMLKHVARYVLERKDELYELSAWTGVTKGDSWIDIEGGLGTFFVYSGKGRREMPDTTVHLDGPVELLSSGGTFVGRHLCVPLEGVAIHINAFNFPCWGMLEKLAPCLLAGMPAIVKPATISSFLAERLVRIILDSGLLPEGALQLISGSVGDLLDHVDCQDVVTFTGSATTGLMLKQHPAVVNNAVRFNMEADSLNFSMLGTGVEPGSAEFDLFVKEIVREMAVKAGQKCTAIRRALIPADRLEAVALALAEKLRDTPVGNPADKTVRMGTLASREQLTEVQERVSELRQHTSLVFGNESDSTPIDVDLAVAAFFPPTILLCDNPLANNTVHCVEAFGPITTLMPYQDTTQAIELVKRGGGSLCGSIFSADNSFVKEVVYGTAAYHGRLLLINSSSAAESTGHGSPLPHLVHGGPGRAGGGEEMGGIRGVLHYMQRTAIQGHPDTLTAVGQEWVRGSTRTHSELHPFRKYFEELQIGDAFISANRVISEEDVLAFAALSGDKFYAHMDDEQAQRGIFEKRVAHGYFLVSAAAGLFVDPDFGPVLANYGLEDLRFIDPVYLGDSIQVRLTVQKKIFKEQREEDKFPQGVIYWDVEIVNQRDEQVALYTILTLVQRKSV